METILYPARTIETPSTDLVVTIADLRKKANLGGDTTFDAELTAAANAAQEWVSKFLGYSVPASTRTDYFEAWARRFALSVEPSLSNSLTVKTQPGNTTFSTLTDPIDAHVAGQKCRYDLSGGVVSLTQAGVDAAGGVELSGFVSNPISIAYTATALNNAGKAAVKEATLNLAHAMYGELALEPSENSLRIAALLLEPFRKM